MSRVSLGCYSFAILAASGVISAAFAQDGSRDLATFFSGHLSAAGTFQNHFDGSTRGVRVDVHGAPGPRGFKLIEDTVYSDGEKHRSLWTFSKVAEGQYIGEGPDFKQTYIFNQSGAADYRLTVSFLFVLVGDACMILRKLPY